MGTWGPALYSDDFALDLKTTVATLCRLPMSGPEVVQALTNIYPVEPANEDHTTFWLVVADQLHRRGIWSDAIDRAVRIIDDGSNLRMLADLGMSEADLRKRRQKLDELRRRVTGPLPERKRRTLKKPQPFVVHPGEIYTFQVDSQGNSYNPYFTNPAMTSFEPVGWGSMLVLRSGHTFGYLTWYQIAPDLSPGLSRPTLDEAVAKIEPSQNDVGTLSRPHLERIGLQLLGRIEPPTTDPPDDQRILGVVSSDISASNIWARYWEPGTLG